MIKFYHHIKAVKHFKSKKESHNFGCSFNTKYYFISVVSLWYRILDPQGSTVGDSGWSTCPNHMRNFLNYFGFPPEFLQALPLTNCLALTRNTSKDSLSESLWRLLPSGMLRNKTVRTFHFCSMEGVVFKSYSCFNIALYPFKVQIWRWSKEVFYEALLQCAEQEGLIKCTLMHSLSTGVIVDVAHTKRVSELKSY